MNGDKLNFGEGKPPGFRKGKQFAANSSLVPFGTLVTPCALMVFTNMYVNKSVFGVIATGIGTRGLSACS